MSDATFIAQGILKEITGFVILLQYLGCVYNNFFPASLIPPRVKQQTSDIYRMTKLNLQYFCIKKTRLLEAFAN
jgi:hypothetical protein